jgi:FAD/FMN-containing dehydrogenase
MTITAPTSDLARDGFHGELLQPESPAYHEARRIWNGAIDRRPALIARCRTTTDVAAAVRFGVRHGLEIAVRGGGHSIPGHSVCDGGLLVDLSRMQRVDVDPVRRRASVEPGVLLAGYDAATQDHGLASPGGEISHTGVAGLTLGGGVGWLSRRYGLACDNLVEAELVTATGEVRTVSEATDPELLWGLRGGGGNFGVVTRFVFTLHEVPPLLAGAVMVELDRGREALRLYRDLCAEAPDELSLTAVCVTAPPAPFVPPHLRGQPVVGIAMAWVGAAADGEPWADRLRALRPAVDLLGLMPYVALQSMFDDGVPHGLCYYVKSEWLGELDDGAIDDVLDAAAAVPAPTHQVLLRQLGGALARVPADATAFSYREAAQIVTIACVVPPGEDSGAHVAWARALWQRLRRISSGGAYVNQIDADEGADRVRAAYAPETWDRLVVLKTRLDPDNVFHLNTNVPPAPRVDTPVR